MSRKKHSLSYADAGVSLAAWHDTKKRITRLVRSTFTGNVVGKFGHFGGLFDISMLKKYRTPVLVSSIDGVGTKLKIAFETETHDTVGEDIVNHCVNDILVLGAAPLFFLDYIGTGRLEPGVAEQILRGMARACRAEGCALIGGETAEMPGFYQAGEYDIAGVIVGIVDEHRIIDGGTICPGDCLIGLRSSGLHTNGYSLARKIVREVARKKWSDTFTPTGRTFGRELLRPHRAYSPVRALMHRGRIKGCAHITGGGFQENVDRILPPDCAAVVETARWRPHDIFLFLQQRGGVGNDEMYRTFNMGIGMVLVTGESDCARVLAARELAPFSPVRIGRIEKGRGNVVMTYEGRRGKGRTAG